MSILIVLLLLKKKRTIVIYSNNNKNNWFIDFLLLAFLLFLKLFLFCIVLLRDCDYMIQLSTNLTTINNFMKITRYIGIKR